MSETSGNLLLKSNEMAHQLRDLQLDPKGRDGGEMENGRGGERELVSGLVSIGPPGCRWADGVWREEAVRDYRLILEIE